MADVGYEVPDRAPVVDGEFWSATDGPMVHDLNPATERPLGEASRAGALDVPAAEERPTRRRPRGLRPTAEPDPLSSARRIKFVYSTHPD
jgi:hypothetical protein